MNARIERRTVTAPAVPRWLRPKLDKAQRRDLAIIQLQKLADVHTGQADESTLWDMVRDALTWSRAAELLGTGEAEMALYLDLVKRLVDHYGATGRVEFTSPSQDLLARLGTAWMEDLAALVDRDAAIAAALWSEARVAAMGGAGEVNAEFSGPPAPLAEGASLP